MKGHPITWEQILIGIGVVVGIAIVTLAVIGALSIFKKPVALEQGEYKCTRIEWYSESGAPTTLWCTDWASFSWNVQVEKATIR